MLHLHVEKGKNNWHHVCHYQCLLKLLNVLSVQVGCWRPSTDKGQKLGKSIPHFFSQESILVVCCTSSVISSIKHPFFTDLLSSSLHDLFMTGVHFWTIISRALCWMFQVHMVLTEEPCRTPCLTPANHLSLERFVQFQYTEAERWQWDSSYTASQAVAQSPHQEDQQVLIKLWSHCGCHVSVEGE